MSCPFCDETNLKRRTLHEGMYARVIASDPSLTKGHLLVTPKRHVEEPWELSRAELQDIFGTLFTYQKLLAQKIGTGCDIRQHYRPFMQQNRLKVDHVHFHLLPRVFKDELYQKSMVFETDLFRNIAEDEVNEIKDLLAEGL